MHIDRVLRSPYVRVVALIITVPWLFGQAAPRHARVATGRVPEQVERGASERIPSEAVLVRDSTASAPLSHATRSPDGGTPAEAILTPGLRPVSDGAVPIDLDPSHLTRPCDINIVHGRLLI